MTESLGEQRPLEKEVAAEIDIPTNDEQVKADAFEAWVYAINLGPEPDFAAVSDPATQQRLVDARARKVASYTLFLLEELDADAERLTAAAAVCRARHVERSAASGPEEQRVEHLLGAELADAALKVVREAGADTDASARDRLRAEIHRRLNPESTPYRQGFWHQHSWPRRILRRLDPRWWVRRESMAGRIHVVHEVAIDVTDIESVHVLADGVNVGSLHYQMCPRCKLGRVDKLSIVDGYQGLGLGTRALRDALARYPGYDWYTTPQYATARTYWKRVGRITGAGFPDRHPHPCPHMDPRK